MKSREGTSLIDLLISMAIVAILFGGVYLVYFSIETAIANVGVRTAATAVVSNEIEMIQNLPYGNVGTVGGVPAGVIPQTQNITYGNFSFVLQTTVLNIDDPYDDSPSSTPVADYKLVDVEASCPLCASTFNPLDITTTVASRNLTAGTPYGSIFVNIINADGVGVPEATVQVVNASVTPSIDVIDTTNASGVLELIGVPTSTQGYQILATKSGFSSAQTYPQGGTGNPNPVSPNITVASETVSTVTLSIDALSTLNVSTTNEFCAPVAHEPISISGTTLIGTSPNVLAFSTTTETGSTGSLFIGTIPWDTYTISLNDPSEDIVGTMPEDPLVINPSSTAEFQFILASATNPALLVNVDDAGNGDGIAQAAITLSKGAFSETLTTDHATFAQSDWSGAGEYAGGNGEINAMSPGLLTLLATASDTYSTSTAGSLISNTVDVGGTSSTFNGISWSPTSEPANTQVEFQVAANNDNATWNFIGPDGTSNTYFMSPGTLPTVLNGNRYFRYEIFMNTQDPTQTPSISNVSLDFTANCVPASQVLFTGLGTGDYNLDVTAPGYLENSTTIQVGSGFQSSTITLIQS